jgi:hypothetical protein
VVPNIYSVAPSHSLPPCSVARTRPRTSSQRESALFHEHQEDAASRGPAQAKFTTRVRQSPRGFPTLLPKQAISRVVFALYRKFGENSPNLREIALFHEQQEEDEPDKFSVVAFGVTTDTCTDKKKHCHFFFLA